MSVVEFPPPRNAVDEMFGPEESGHTVIIDGRLIPNLMAHDHGEMVSFTLDGRFGYTVPRQWAYLFASAIGTAMAIGAGYPCIAAETKDRPFAPRVFKIDAPTEG